MMLFQKPSGWPATLLMGFDLWRPTECQARCCWAHSVTVMIVQLLYACVVRHTETHIWVGRHARAAKKKWSASLPALCFFLVGLA